ncbi:hypothetical protein [Halalkalibacter krulwichiae]|uniref:Uncharacterized protein n=1 Tax=Halalkalibacter krulwichiae TaxID=199441 RepID=A0A1Y9THE5_9BACI|nr:hypothetical protein [Halalkalibacter krulwichiae]ARK28605.1 hypothetical protein BkAM31D_01280 [Halalkalibacter krulwichiae]
MTENQAISFLACPYQFYETSTECWKEEVQTIINKIVDSYDQLSKSEKTYYQALKIISVHWSQLDRKLFESKSEYLLVSAKVIDQLLSLLVSEMGELPFFNNETKCLESIESKVDEGVVLKKILLEVDEPLLITYWNIAEKYCYRTNGNSPNQFEVIDVLNAKRYVRFPTRVDKQLMS